MAILVLNGETKSISASELESQNIGDIIMSNGSDLTITTKLTRYQDIRVNITDSKLRYTPCTYNTDGGFSGVIKDSDVYSTTAYSFWINVPATLIIDNCHFYGLKYINHGYNYVLIDNESNKRICPRYETSLLILKNLHNMYFHTYAATKQSLVKLENCTDITLTSCRSDLSNNFLDQIKSVHNLYLVPKSLGNNKYGYTKEDINKARAVVRKTNEDTNYKIHHFSYSSYTGDADGYVQVQDVLYPFDELIAEEWNADSYDELDIFSLPERIYHTGGRIFKIKDPTGKACLPVQCFISNSDNFDPGYASDDGGWGTYFYKISPWRRFRRRGTMSPTKKTKLKLQLAPNYFCRVKKIIDTNFNSVSETYESGNSFKFIEIEGYMGDSLNSLDIMAKPIKFINGSVTINQESAFIDGSLVVITPVSATIKGSIFLPIARAEIYGVLEIEDDGGGRM